MAVEWKKFGRGQWIAVALVGVALALGCVQVAHVLSDRASSSGGETLRFFSFHDRWLTAWRHLLGCVPSFPLYVALLQASSLG